MPTDTTPPSRRNRLFARWFLVLVIATFGWSGWRAYAFRSAIGQAKALGWVTFYTDPVEEIRRNWRAAFKKDTWTTSAPYLTIPTTDELIQHLSMVHRLNPGGLRIYAASTMRDLAAVKSLSRVYQIYFSRCEGLTNVNGIERLYALRSLILDGCTGLTNVDGLKNLTTLEEVWLTGSTGLVNVDAIKGISSLKAVVLNGCTSLITVDALKDLSNLNGVHLVGCTGLTNVDALNGLSHLKIVRLNGCTGLTNIDGLKNISTLEEVRLDGCTGITKESVAALKEALPKTQIYGP